MGVGGGFGLVIDPSSEPLGIPLAWLDGSPFADYLVPGIVSLTVLGHLGRFSRRGAYGQEALLTPFVGRERIPNINRTREGLHVSW
jgi:hypothetical protein